jgi:hypothetical protein
MANGCWPHKVAMAGHIPGVCAQTSHLALRPLVLLKIGGVLTPSVAILEIVPFKVFSTLGDPSQRWSWPKDSCAWQSVVVIEIDKRKVLGYPQPAMSSMANQTLGLDCDSP